MRVKHLALHQLYPNSQKGIDSLHTSFDIEAYSRFKYGDKRVAQQYAQELVRKLLQNPQDLPCLSTPVFISSSAFRYVPTAAQSILNAFLSAFTQQLPQLKLQYFKIHRNYLDGRDYAQLTPEERENVLKQAQLSVDDSTHLRNQTVWVIDDIRITGKHEEKILEFLQKLGVKEVKCLYVAQLQHGLERSWLEHYINHAWIKDLERFEEILYSPCFQLNARVCKFLLSYPCHTSLKAFLERLDLAKITLLYHAIKQDNFDEVENYRHAFLLLEDIFLQKSLANAKNILEISPESWHNTAPTALASF